jgi:lipopolysaccharide transport system permease protein
MPPVRPVTRIRPPTGALALPWRDLYVRRELLGFFVWRDIKIRYKQTALGAAWAVLQPLFAMLVFTLVFGRLAKLHSDRVPYSTFAYAGLVPWVYFSNSLGQSSGSLVDNERVIEKVYFPRALLPLSSLFSGLLDLAIAMVLLIVLAFWSADPLRWPSLLLPVWIGVAGVTAGGVGLVLSCANVRFRDVRYVVPFLIQLWLFASPVVYSSSLVPHRWRWAYGLNPMATVIDGFRWSLLGTPRPPWAQLASTTIVATFSLIAGLMIFHRAEHSFADIL